MANNKKINLDKGKKIFKVIEAVDKTADSIILSGGETDETEIVKKEIRVSKQAIRTEASLLRLQGLLISELKKRKKTHTSKNKNSKKTFENNINKNETIVIEEKNGLQKTFKNNTKKDKTIAIEEKNSLQRTFKSNNRKSQKSLVDKTNEPQVISISENVDVIIPSKKKLPDKAKSKEPIIITLNESLALRTEKYTSKNKSSKNNMQRSSDKPISDGNSKINKHNKNINISNKDNKLRAATKKVVSESVALASAALDAKVDKSKTTDTGIESAKQAISTTKKTVQTVDKSVKTVKTTVRTIKNTPKNIKNTIQNTKRAAKATYRTTKVVVKATVKVLKVAVKILSKIIAFFIENPIVLVAVLIILLICYVVHAGTIVFVGNSQDGANTKIDFGEAGGLDDVPKNLQDALKLLEECKNEKKEKFYNEHIKKLKYSDSNDEKKNSDLVYEVRYSSDGNPPTPEHPAFEYKIGFADESKKNNLKDSFDWGCAVDDIDILASAYVIAEIKANSSLSDSYQVKDIKFTKEVINQVLDEVVKFDGYYVPKDSPETTWCNDRDCVEKVEERDNPAYKELEESYNRLCEGLQWWDYGEEIGGARDGIMEKIVDYRNLPEKDPARIWGWQQILDDIGGWYERYGHYKNFDLDEDIIRNPNASDYGVSVYWYIFDVINQCLNNLNNTPQTIKDISRTCEKKHLLYSISLDFFPTDAILTNLKFEETEKLWFDYTAEYFSEVLSTSETE